MSYAILHNIGPPPEFVFDLHGSGPVVGEMRGDVGGHVGVADIAEEFVLELDGAVGFTGKGISWDGGAYSNRGCRDG